MKNNEDLVRLWQRKGDNDLVTAEAAIAVASPPVDTTCFHAQQCAEKYLKAFLIHTGIQFQKTHNLEDLIRLAMTRDEAFQSLIEAGGALTPYAVEVRYPGMLDEELTIDDARTAIELARRIKSFVIAALKA